MLLLFGAIVALFIVSNFVLFKGEDGGVFGFKALFLSRRKQEDNKDGE